MEIVIPYPPEKNLPGKRMIRAQRKNADVFQDKLTDFQDDVMNLVLKKNMPPIVFRRWLQGFAPGQGQKVTAVLPSEIPEYRYNGSG
jgi:hypothetical protein